MKVELLGTYGGDQTHALSAWTSTSRDLTDEKRQRIPALLKRLATDGHETPFEKSSLHFLVTTDIATHIHLIKHRIGVSVNAESARYKEFKEDNYYVPEDWKGFTWYDELVQHVEKSFKLYHEATESLTGPLGRKRAKESARFFLPYCIEITSDVMFNFRSFMHFLHLRYDEHAQTEVYTLAKLMLEQVREKQDFKYSLEAFGYGTS